MNTTPHTLQQPLRALLPSGFSLALGLGLLALGTAHAAIAPSQKPLLSSVTGAKPNVMITLDNSGSMAFPYHETYAINSATLPDEKYWCEAPLYGWDSSKSGNARWVQGWYANDRTCYTRIGYTSSSYRQNSNTKVKDPASNTTWYAMRSADVNPIFYNPRLTYSPRVNEYGQALPVTDNIRFISNQNTAETTFCSDDSAKTNNYSYLGGYWNTRSNCNNAGYNPAYSQLKTMVPKIEEHTSSSANSAFTWVVCDTPVYNTSKQETGCLWGNISQIEEITLSRTTAVKLPSNHQRTDCGANATHCSAAAERQNILNWYRYYAFRAPAVATAIGIALANDDYRESLRIGYYNINEGQSANNAFIGIDSNAIKFRGVRLSSRANNKALYDWLYGHGSFPIGGTPLHNSVDRVADYFALESKSSGGKNPTITAAKENPWAQDPSRLASANNSELSCRRSFNILFSDGAWNQGTETITTEHDYADASVIAAAPSTPFIGGFTKYIAKGYSNTEVGRKLYTPFGNPNAKVKGSLSDLTAKYFWHKDLRPDTANEIQPRMGQPTTWQNMATYTVGYLIRPTGELPGATKGLTFKQIEDYKRNYISLGSSATKPTWATDVTSNTDEQGRIDDFIQAGFTGGGAGYSVTTPDDVRRTFDLILSDILNSSGKDAGVALTGSSSTSDDLAGRIKYTADYKTIDNSGQIDAVRLDADGKDGEAVWSASDKIPSASTRRFFALDGAADERVVITQNTQLSGLPNGLKAALNGNGKLKTDSSFLRYLLGDDTQTDANGALMRQRSSMMASSVNSAPLLVGSRQNMGYGRTASGLPAAAKDSYVDFFKKKNETPEIIYAATNAGVVHVINGADENDGEEIRNASGAKIQPGAEVAAYLIKDTMPKLQDFAKPSYSFEYLVDGPLVEHDMWDGSAWKQMVFGSTGRGGKAVFAFNSPLNTGSKPDRIPSASDYKWEKTYAHMGHVTNGAAAGITTEGKAILLVNSGHYANTGAAGLYVLDALTGEELKFIALPSTYVSDIGLGGVTAVLNAKRQIVAAYAGDANGNMWRFKLSGSPSQWGVSNNRPLFTTQGNQPIYAAPAWQAHPGSNGHACQTQGPGKCGTIVTFATGILLDEDHLSNTSTQSIYGIWDNIGIGEPDQAYNLGAGGTTSLVQQEIELDSATAGTGKSAGHTYYRVTNKPVNWSQHRGWKIDMGKLPGTTGERVVGDPANIGSTVFFTSVVMNKSAILEDSCTASAGAVNVMYGIDALTGSLRRAFDQDGDKKLDQFSVVYLPEGGFTRSTVTTNRRDPNSNLYDANLKAGVGDAKAGDIDLLVRDKATGETGYITGVMGSILVGDGRGNTGWYRTWRPIQHLPASLR